MLISIAVDRFSLYLVRVIDHVFNVLLKTINITDRIKECCQVGIVPIFAVIFGRDAQNSPEQPFPDFSLLSRRTARGKPAGSPCVFVVN
jgi:hypothetical protein